MTAALDGPAMREALRGHGYLADIGLATAASVAIGLGRPLLLEGEPGVGKTEAAKAMAEVLGVPLVRLQCYEGIDVSQALYDWDYPRQLLAARVQPGAGDAAAPNGLFDERFLLERPLLRALRADGAVLLIDEIDRADDEFEAFLLELLSDFQVTIPELGTVAAKTRPAVVLTSNRTRELHDALRRRCLYHWIEYPGLEREIEIVCLRAPEVPPKLAAHVAAAVARLRALDLVKPPGVAETVDWARALAFVGADRLDSEVAERTLGSVIKDREDIDVARLDLAEVVGV